MDVMVDLETLGNNSSSVILSIGAVEFDARTGQLGRQFYRVVDPASCEAFGLKMDVSTVLWWLQQGGEAREVFRETAKIPLTMALAEFSMWYPEKACLWGNGASFDNVILANAYAACGQKAPWMFWDDRCYRTLKNLLPEVEHERKGVHHNALDDAIYQAEHAIKLLQVLGN